MAWLPRVSLRVLDDWPAVPWDKEGEESSTGLRKRKPTLHRDEAPEYLCGNPYLTVGYR